MDPHNIAPDLNPASSLVQMDEAEAVCFLHTRLNELAELSGTPYRKLLDICSDEPTACNEMPPFGSPVNEIATYAFVKFFRGLQMNPHVLKLPTPLAFKLEQCILALHVATEKATRNNPHIIFEVPGPGRFWVKSANDQARCAVPTLDAGCPPGSDNLVRGFSQETTWQGIFLFMLRTD